MPASRIYLDHQSTAPMLPAVREAMLPYLQSQQGLSTSVYQEGLRLRQALEEARAQVASFLGSGSPDGIVFASSGTEALNLAVKGSAWANARHGRHLVASAVEHPAILRSMEWLETAGFHSTRVAVDRNGRVDPEAIREALTRETILVAVQHVNADIGTVQPWAELAELCAERGIPLLVDATAAAGLVPLDVTAVPFGMIVLAPHRFGGPKGIGILHRHRRCSLHPAVHGGDQEFGLRAGTENIAAIIGAGVAARLAAQHGNAWAEETRKRQRQLWEGLSRHVSLMRLNGPAIGPSRAPHNLNVSVEFVEGEALALALDLKGVAVHSGPACLAGNMKIAPVLTALGLSPALARASVLLSPGHDTPLESLDRAIAEFAATAERLRGMSAPWDAYQSGQLPSDITGALRRSGQ